MKNLFILGLSCYFNNMDVFEKKNPGNSTVFFLDRYLLIRETFFVNQNEYFFSLDTFSH